MFRRWIGDIWRNNKVKIVIVIKCLGVVLLIAFIAYSLLSIIGKNIKIQEENEVAEDTEHEQIYFPTTTVISGSDVSEQVFEQESDLVDLFLKYCNNGQVEEAYKLISDDCREVKYQSIDRFKELYYDLIFTEKRTYNIQSWISEGNYHTYQIRFVNDAMATGEYKKDNVYQDYITIEKGENDEKKISIGDFIKKEELNKSIPEDEQLNITIKNKVTYMDCVVYTIHVENKTDKKITLDCYEDLLSTKIIMDNNVNYGVDWSSISPEDFILRKLQKKDIELKFFIPYGISSRAKKMEFANIVLDYDEYIKIDNLDEQEAYANKKTVQISL